MNTLAPSPALRRVTRLVGLLNLGYFAAGLAVALKIGSVSLFADSIDFLEDASVDSHSRRAGLGYATARQGGNAARGVFLVPGLATLWTAWSKFNALVAPSPVLVSFTATWALVINLSCALMLARYRTHGGSLTQAAFLSARNDALANVAIVVVGLVTAIYPSAWPDLVVGLGIAALNADAARAAWRAARAEHPSA